MRLETEYQSPNDRITYAADFSSLLLTGVTVSSATASAVNSTTGATDNSVLVSTTCTITTPKAFFTVYHGTANKKYDVTVLATLSNNDVREIVLPIEVKTS